MLAVVGASGFNYTIGLLCSGLTYEILGLRLFYCCLLSERIVKTARAISLRDWYFIYLCDTLYIQYKLYVNPISRG